MIKKKVIESSQHRFTKNKSCLTKIIAFCWVTDTVDKGKAVDVIYLDPSKAFDTVSHSILFTELAKYELNR